MDNDLQKAIQFVKEDKKIEGGRILAKLVKEEPDNEQAWLWLSVCVAPVEQKRHCLKQALRINPNNEQAKKQIDRLEEFQPVFINASPSLETAINRGKSQEKAANRQRNKTTIVSKYLIGCFALLLLTGLCLAGVWILRRQGYLNFPTTNNSPIFSQSIKPLSEFNNEDIRKSLLTPNDLTFAGIHSPSDWKTCSESEIDDAFTVDHSNNAYQIDSNVQIVITRFYTGSECYGGSDGAGDGVVEEGIFLFPNAKQAERFTEVAKIQEQKLPMVLYNIISVPWNQYEFWIMQSQEKFEASTLIVQKEEAVFIIFIFNTTKLVTSDLTDIGTNALENIIDTQNQSR